MFLIMVRGMRTLTAICVVILCTMTMPAFAKSWNEANITRDVTVLSDPSLSVPLSLIAREYAKEFKVPVSTIFGSSKEHLERILDGEEANLFIAAKPSWMKTLQQQGVIDVYSRTSIARNKLVFVGPEHSHEHVNSAFELADDIMMADADAMFAIGDPEYLAEGTYTLEALRNLNINTELEPHYIIFNDHFSLKKNIEKYNSYGSIFYTDALIYPSLRIIDTLDDGTHEPITYQAAIVIGDNMEGARHFMQFLTSEKATSIFRHYGFLSAR